MTKKQAIKWVKSMRLQQGDATNCAVDLCIYDIEMHGLNDWLGWDPIDISKMFAEMTRDSVKQMIDEIDSKQAGESLIDELLGSDQERLDILEESKKLATTTTKMLEVLTKYHSIHEFIKATIDEENNTYR
jgi:hypothetical protein